MWWTAARELREWEKTEQKLITRWWNSKRPPPLYISRVFPPPKGAGHDHLERKKTPVAPKWLSAMKIWRSLNRSSGALSLYLAWIPADQRAVACFYFNIFKKQLPFYHDINVVWREWRLVPSNTLKNNNKKTTTWTNFQVLTRCAQLVRTCSFSVTGSRTLQPVMSSHMKRLHFEWINKWEQEPVSWTASILKCKT